MPRGTTFTFDADDAILPGFWTDTNRNALPNFVPFAPGQSPLKGVVPAPPNDDKTYYLSTSGWVEIAGLIYKGTWDASTNTPTIPAANSQNSGWYYIVATSGTTNINGINDWAVGDWLLSNGSTWQKIDQSWVVSVAGLTGVITTNALRSALSINNVDNTSDLNKPVSTATQAALDLKANTSLQINGYTLTGNITLGKGDVGLGNADNTSDANKPISNATQAALDLKADKAITISGHDLSASFTLVKADVGLSNVDNTSDANKPISNATQAALDLKAPLNSPALTGTPTTPTPSLASSDTTIASTAFVQGVVGSAVAGLLEMKGDLNASSNPNYPAASKATPTTSPWPARSVVLPGRAWTSET